MRKIFRYLIILLEYYNKFGFDGIVYLYKKRYKKNKLISFSNPKFLFPIYLRNNTSDIQTFRQVIFEEGYLMSYDFEPKIILDCGANIGLSAVYFKTKFPNSKIIAIEPEQSNFEQLLLNTKDYDDVHCLQGGIWNKSANLVLKDAGIGNWGFYTEESEFPITDSIKTYTILDIMKQFNLTHIDILKIDIEGSEKEIFESNYKEWLSKTKVIIIEFHDRYREGCSATFFKTLSNYNYSMANRKENIFVFIK